MSSGPLYSSLVVVVLFLFCFVFGLYCMLLLGSSGQEALRAQASSSPPAAKDFEDLISALCSSGLGGKIGA